MTSKYKHFKLDPKTGKYIERHGRNPNKPKIISWKSKKLTKELKNEVDLMR